MCMICVELIKQNMTMLEAGKASDELIVTAKPEEDTTHYKDLKESIEEMDIEKLGNVLEEGKIEQGLDKWT